MPTVDFKAFATDPGANVMDQADYLAAVFLASGFAAGLAQSPQLNKVWRQSSVMSAALATYIANQTGQNVLDDGDLAGLIAKLAAAVSVGAAIRPIRLVTVSTPLVLTSADYAVGLARTAAPAAMTASLPADAQNGQTFVIEDLSSNFSLFPVTVSPPAGDTFAGLATFTLNINKQSAAFRRYPSNLWSVKS